MAVNALTHIATCDLQQDVGRPRTLGEHSPSHTFLTEGDRVLVVSKRYIGTRFSSNGYHGVSFCSPRQCLPAPTKPSAAQPFRHLNRNRTHSLLGVSFFSVSCFSCFPPPARDAPDIAPCLKSGLKAVEATSKAEQLATVPAKAAISLTAKEPTPFKSWVSADVWDRCASPVLFFRPGGTVPTVWSMSE